MKNSYSIKKVTAISVHCNLVLLETVHYNLILLEAEQSNNSFLNIRKNSRKRMIFFKRVSSIK